MEILGKSKYAGYKAVSDSKIYSEISKSENYQYFERETLMPIMNSDISEIGVPTASSTYDAADRAPWKIFDGSIEKEDNKWCTQFYITGPQYLHFKFNEDKYIYKAEFRVSPDTTQDNGTQIQKLITTLDGENWEEISTNSQQSLTFVNAQIKPNRYKGIGMKFISTTNYYSCFSLAEMKIYYKDIP